MIEHPGIYLFTSMSVWGQYGFKMGYNGVSVCSVSFNNTQLIKGSK